MEEMIGLEVRVVLMGTTGTLSMNGRILKVYSKMILLETSQGPLYVMIHAIKMILVIGDKHESN